MTTLREKLAEAGKKFDGHVTNGSLDEQVKVVNDSMEAFGKVMVQDHDNTTRKYIGALWVLANEENYGMDEKFEAYVQVQEFVKALLG